MRELNHKGIVTYERIIDKNDSVTLISRDDDHVTFMEQTAASGEIITTTKDAEGNVIITNRRPYKKNK